MFCRGGACAKCTAGNGVSRPQTAHVCPVQLSEVLAKMADVIRRLHSEPRLLVKWRLINSYSATLLSDRALGHHIESTLMTIENAIKLIHSVSDASVRVEQIRRIPRG